MDNNLKKYKYNQFDSWLKIEKDFNLPINLYVDDIREPIPNTNISFFNDKNTFDYIYLKN